MFDIKKVPKTEYKIPDPIVPKPQEKPATKQETPVAKPAEKPVEKKDTSINSEEKSQDVEKKFNELTDLLENQQKFMLEEEKPLDNQQIVMLEEEKVQDVPLENQQKFMLEEEKKVQDVPLENQQKINEKMFFIKEDFSK